jgi:hypothetical protein
MLLAGVLVDRVLRFLSSYVAFAPLVVIFAGFWGKKYENDS